MQDCDHNQLTNAYVEGYQLTILGDFNIDLMVNNTASYSWLNLTKNFQLKQLVNKPTRVTSSSSTLVGHIFTSHPAKVRNVDVPKIGLSDHYPTCVVFKNNFGTKRCHSTIKYRSFKNFDQKQFLDDLNQCPWNSINSTENIDNMLEIWYTLFLDVINKHLPLQTKIVKMRFCN